jgi:hypothetical protein
VCLRMANTRRQRKPRQRNYAVRNAANPRRRLCRVLKIDARQGKAGNIARTATETSCGPGWQSTVSLPFAVCKHSQPHLAVCHELLLCRVPLRLPPLRWTLLCFLCAVEVGLAYLFAVSWTLSCIICVVCREPQFYRVLCAQFAVS